MRPSGTGWNVYLCDAVEHSDPSKVQQFQRLPWEGRSWVGAANLLQETERKEGGGGKVVEMEMDLNPKVRVALCRN